MQFSHDVARNLLATSLWSRLPKVEQHALLSPEGPDFSSGYETRPSVNSEQDSVTSVRMLAKPIRLQQSCDSILTQHYAVMHRSHNLSYFQPPVHRGLTESEVSDLMRQNDHLQKHPHVIKLDYCQKEWDKTGPKVLRISVKESTELPKSVNVTLPGEVVEIPVQVVSYSFSIDYIYRHVGILMSSQENILQWQTLMRPHPFS